MEKLMADLKKAVKPSQHFWTRMPYAMCTNTASTQLDDTIFFDNSDDDESEAVFSIPHGALNNDECWNGVENGNYKAAVVEDGISNQVHNPEVPLKMNPHGGEPGLPNIVKEQIFQLRSITNQLKIAHKGQDVEWWDRELERRDKSTSLNEGSGDYASFDGHDDDEDFLPNEGSGSHGHFDSDDEDDEEEDGSGDRDDDHDDDEHVEKSSESPKINEPWRPWSPAEIEVIKPSVPKNDESGKTSSGGNSRHTFANSRSYSDLALAVIKLLLPTLFCVLSSFLMQSDNFALKQIQNVSISNSESFKTKVSSDEIENTISSNLQVMVFKHTILEKSRIEL